MKQEKTKPQVDNNYIQIFVGRWTILDVSLDFLQPFSSATLTFLF